jgi:glycosyltransferase involved in cell wall biosynthesis
VRILHITTRFLREGGAERNLAHTIQWQQDQGHEVYLAAGRGSARTLLPSDAPMLIVESLERRVNPRYDAIALRDLQNIIRRGGYDVVHTHESKAGILGRVAAWRSRVRIVHTVHMPSFGGAYSAVGSNAFLRAEQACARITDVIVTVGEQLRDSYLEAHVGRQEQYRVIRSPIEVEKFGAVRPWKAAERDAARVHFGLPAGTRVILSVGALEPRKRHDLLLSAVAPLLRSKRSVLAIAGEGPARQQLMSQAESLRVRGGVHFLGNVERVDWLMACSDLLVHTARAEGVPQVLIQALASGLSAVMTDAIGARELSLPAITVVAADAARIREAVDSQLIARPVPAPLHYLSAWRREAVEHELMSLDSFLRSRVAAHPMGRKPQLQCG